MLGPLLDVQTSKRRTLLWRAKRISKSKVYKTPHVRTFGGSDVVFAWKAQGIVHLVKSEENVKVLWQFQLQLRTTTRYYTMPHYATVYYATQDSNTHHYTALHYTTLHYTTLRFTTLHPLHYTTLHYTLHYITLYYITLVTAHYTTIHSITVHST